MKIRDRLSGAAEIVFGPVRQLRTRMTADKYDEDGNVSRDYMNAVNEAIPYEISEFVEWIIKTGFSSENEEAEGGSHIRSRTKILYSMLGYKWYSPDETDSDDFYY